METTNKDQMNEQIKKVDQDLATVRERLRVDQKLAEEGFQKQIRALESQLDYFKLQVEKNKLKASQAGQDLSQSTREAWDELREGVDRALKKVLH